MTSIKVFVEGSTISATLDGKLTSGMVGVPVEIEYNQDWENLSKICIFRVGSFSRQRERVDKTTTVPWEVLRNFGKNLEVGIQGKSEDGEIVIPTVWATVGLIHEGANATIPGAPNPGESKPPVGGELIDDGIVSLQRTWSSQKISDAVNNAADAVKAWSSKHTVEEISGAVGNVASITKTGNVVLIEEKDPYGVVTDLNAQKTTIYGVNHFDIDSAEFSAVGGYSSSTPMVKENNGIKIIGTLASSGVYTAKKTTFTAPFTGTLYCSCEADCTGPIRDVCFKVTVNDVDQSSCYGKGLLYQAVEVTAGDTVAMLFYTHMGSTEANTIYYKNIQVAYGGLYDFVPYSEPITNEREGNVQKTFVLPADASAWIANTTSGTGGLYRFVCSTQITDMLAYPTSQNAIPAGVSVTGADLVTYNQTYNGTEGVGIDKTGAVSVYLADVQTKTDMAAYLASNPITITYTSTDVEQVQEDIEKSVFYQGEILEFETPQEVSYKYKPQEKKLTCVCFGDSITGMFANKTDYPSMMEMGTDLICHNVGFAGTQLTDHSSATYQPFSMNRLADAVASGDFSTQDAKAATAGGLYPAHLETLKSIDFSKVDFVTMLYGTNDWNAKATLESVEDALKHSISTLLTAYPHLQIIVLTPYWRSVSSGNDSDVDANGNGVYLYEYADHIQKVAEESYHVPAINLYRTLGANAITNRYFANDGTHPTERTKRIIANKILNVIRENR